MTQQGYTFVIGQYDNTRIEDHLIHFHCSYTTEDGEHCTLGPYADVSWNAALEWAKMKVRWKGRYNVTVVRID